MGDEGMGPWRHGAMEAWGHGGMGPWRHGAMEAWKHGAMEAWRHGGMGAWKHGAMEAWKHGAMEAWRHGGNLTLAAGIGAWDSHIGEHGEVSSDNCGVGELAQCSHPTTPHQTPPYRPRPQPYCPKPHLGSNEGGVGAWDSHIGQHGEVSSYGGGFSESAQSPDPTVPH
ncbi:unnamed protein product [Closterium sp. NIES-64]|nr:unnamed protein product [Closterium sp. NIES-64]